jgi:hypothetical protein
MPKEGAVFLIPAKPDLQHLLAPFAALFLLDNARSGHNGCGRASVKNASSNISVEEILNSCTHGIGLVLSIAGFMVLLALSIRRGTAWHIVGCAIYGSTLICLYLASTVYHGVTLPRLKRFENLRPLADLSADCRNLHTIPAR